MVLIGSSNHDPHPYNEKPISNHKHEGGWAWASCCVGEGGDLNIWNTHQILFEEMNTNSKNINEASGMLLPYNGESETILVQFWLQSKWCFVLNLWVHHFACIRIILYVHSCGGGL